MKYAGKLCACAIAVIALSGCSTRQQKGEQIGEVAPRATVPLNITLPVKMDDDRRAEIEVLARSLGADNEKFVTDAGLAHLKGLTGLKMLYLRDTQVTRAGDAELKAALPELNIER